MNTLDRRRNDLLLHTGYGYVSSSIRPIGIFRKMGISIFSTAAFLALLLITLHFS